MVRVTKKSHVAVVCIARHVGGGWEWRKWGVNVERDVLEMVDNKSIDGRHKIGSKEGEVKEGWSTEISRTPF